MPILCSCLLYLLDQHALRDIHQCLYCIYPYIHSVYCFVLVFLMVVLGKPICNKKSWPWLVYYSDPVLMYSQEDMLNFLLQGCYIFFEYSHKGFMICYYIYIPSKTIMMKFFKTMQYTQWFSFNIALPTLCTGQAFTLECYGSENGIVWSAIFWAYYASLVCNRVALSPILNASVSR